MDSALQRSPSAVKQSLAFSIATYCEFVFLFFRTFGLVLLCALRVWDIWLIFAFKNSLMDVGPLCSFLFSFLRPIPPFFHWPDRRSSIGAVYDLFFISRTNHVCSIKPKFLVLRIFEWLYPPSHTLFNVFDSFCPFPLPTIGPSIFKKKTFLENTIFVFLLLNFYFFFLPLWGFPLNLPQLYVLVDEAAPDR